MRSLIAPAAIAILLCSGAAQAAENSASSQNSQTAPANQQTNVNSANQQQSLATAQKLKQDLQNAGFTNVNVMAEAFVVRAKTKNGDPVVMTIGPNGFEAVEALPVRNTNISGGAAAGPNSSSSQPNSGR